MCPSRQIIKPARVDPRHRQGRCPDASRHSGCRSSHQRGESHLCALDGQLVLVIIRKITLFFHLGPHRLNMRVSGTRSSLISDFCGYVKRSGECSTRAFLKIGRDVPRVITALKYRCFESCENNSGYPSPRESDPPALTFRKLKLFCNNNSALRTLLFKFAEVFAVRPLRTHSNRFQLNGTDISAEISCQAAYADRTVSICAVWPTMKSSP